MSLVPLCIQQHALSVIDTPHVFISSFPGTARFEEDGAQTKAIAPNQQCYALPRSEMLNSFPHCFLPNASATGGPVSGPRLINVNTMPTRVPILSESSVSDGTVPANRPTAAADASPYRTAEGVEAGDAIQSRPAKHQYATECNPRDEAAQRANVSIGKIAAGSTDRKSAGVDGNHQIHCCRLREV
ncbi:hypothetical protein E4U53_001183 [Claviceps sorghi]|nr:hypothetical protein E4U53_001183 [Claviceps sorghi]